MNSGNIDTPSRLSGNIDTPSRLIRTGSKNSHIWNGADISTEEREKMHERDVEREEDFKEELSREREKYRQDTCALERVWEHELSQQKIRWAAERSAETSRLTTEIDAKDLELGRVRDELQSAQELLHEKMVESFDGAILAQQEKSQPDGESGQLLKDETERQAREVAELQGRASRLEAALQQQTADTEFQKERLFESERMRRALSDELEKERRRAKVFNASADEATHIQEARLKKEQADLIQRAERRHETDLEKVKSRLTIEEERANLMARELKRERENVSKLERKLTVITEASRIGGVSSRASFLPSSFGYFPPPIVSPAATPRWLSAGIMSMNNLSWVPAQEGSHPSSIKSLPIQPAFVPSGMPSESTRGRDLPDPLEAFPQSSSSTDMGLDGQGLVKEPTPEVRKTEDSAGDCVRQPDTSTACGSSRQEQAPVDECQNCAAAKAAIEWARSSQQGAENRLEILISDFEDQRSELQGIIKGLQQELEKTKDKLNDLSNEHAEASKSLKSITTAHERVQHEHSELLVSFKCASVASAKLHNDLEAGQTALEKTRALLDASEDRANSLASANTEMSEDLRARMRQQAKSSVQASRVFSLLFARSRRRVLEDAFNDFFVKVPHDLLLAHEAILC